MRERGGSLKAAAVALVGSIAVGVVGAFVTPAGAAGVRYREGHSSRTGIADWPAFLYRWVIQKMAPPIALPPGVVPTIPAVRVPSALVPRNLVPGLPV